MPLPDVAVDDIITAAHINAVKDAAELIPDAVDVPFAPAGTIAATTVQAAIEEVAAEAGSGSAASISFTPAGSIAATNVQDAIEEVAAEAGGSGSAWTLEIDLPLSTLTGWTVEAGTWSIGSSVIQKTNTGGSTFRLRYDTALSSMLECVVEVEVRLDSTTGNAGLTVGVPSAGGNGGLRVDLRGNGTNVTAVGYEQDALVAQGTTSISSIAYGTWITLRAHVILDTSEAFVNGTSVGPKQQAVGVGPKIGLVGADAAASFRNLRVWTRPQP